MCEKVCYFSLHSQRVALAQRHLLEGNLHPHKLLIVQQIDGLFGECLERNGCLADLKASESEVR